MRLQFYIVLTSLLISSVSKAQSADELIRKVKAKMDKVNDYIATGKMKTDVVFRRNDNISAILSCF